MDRTAVERRLADCRPFADPRADLEQYATPADLAAHLVHLAALQGDLQRPVLDLGTGTGVLALGAALAGADRVVGVDLDPDALAVARANARRVDRPDAVTWVLGDARTPPVCPAESPTVVANPPFGAVDGHEGADRAFLETAAALGGVSYTLHNEGSRDFVAAFAADRGGSVTRAYRADFDVPRQFPWHERERATLPVEVLRVDWR